MTSTTPDDAPDAADSPEPKAADPQPPTPADAPPGNSGVTQEPSVSEPSIWDNPPESPLPEGYYAEDGTPTFDAVRARIEERAATADGRQELDSDLPRERDFHKEQEDLKKAGADRLAQLRKSMGLDK